MSKLEGDDTARKLERKELIQLASNLYRDEMRRTVAWRSRLDTTSNWAVVLTASILTFAFSSEDNPHYLLLVAIGGVVAFTFIEARRYRHYDVWRSRIRLLEENLFAAAFRSSDELWGGQWTRRLAEDLRQPTYKVSYIRALRHRLRRIYLALLLMLILSWVVRITSFSDGALDISRDAAIGAIPGTWVAGALGLLVVAALTLTAWPVDGRGQLQPEEDEEAEAAWD